MSITKLDLNEFERADIVPNLDPSLQDANCVNQETQVLTYTWEGAGFCWNFNPYCWDDVQFVMRFADGDTVSADGDGLLPDPELFQVYNRFEEEEKKKFITLVCKVEGYDETRTTKEVKERDVTVSDIKKTVTEILRTVNVQVNN